MKWQEAEPVLQATYALLEHNDHITGGDVNAALGRDEGDAQAARALEYLDRAGYINASFSLGFALPHLIRATEKGLQYCAGWPTPGSSSTFMAEFLRAIDERAEATGTPDDERGRLRRFADAASGVGRDVLTDIASKVIEHQAGL